MTKRKQTTLRVPSGMLEEMRVEAQRIGMTLNAFLIHLFETFRGKSDLQRRPQGSPRDHER